MPKPRWQEFEKDTAEALGLDLTLASGSKWFDIGDAVTRGCDSDFSIMAECKFTEHSSFSINSRKLGGWVDRAQELGKRFVLAVRIWPRGALGSRDYVVLPLDDFAELLEMTKTKGVEYEKDQDGKDGKDSCGTARPRSISPHA